MKENLIPGYLNLDVETRLEILGIWDVLQQINVGVQGAIRSLQASLWMGKVFLCKSIGGMAEDLYKKYLIGSC